VYYVNNCQKANSDKRYVFEISLKDKNCTNVYTYQALSYDDYKTWFAIMEGKELTPVLSTYSIKTDPICNYRIIQSPYNPIFNNLFTIYF
jgi:hypothetical protein